MYTNAVLVKKKGQKILIHSLSFYCLLVTYSFEFQKLSLRIQRITEALFYLLKFFFFREDDEQMPLSHGDFGCFGGDLVADTEREGACEVEVLSFVFEASERDIAADGVKGENGSVIEHALFERNAGIDHHHGVIAVEDRAECAALADIGKRLNVGKGVVKSAADAADDDDLVCTAVQRVFDAEHSVRIILDRGEAGRYSGLYHHLYERGVQQF